MAGVVFESGSSTFFGGSEDDTCTSFGIGSGVVVMKNELEVPAYIGELCWLEIPGLSRQSHRTEKSSLGYR
jgi:hypothetical protein